jgi:hypothetical protein
LQPLDVLINKPFKVYMREEWNKWMMDETQHEFTPKGALKRPTIKQVRTLTRLSQETALLSTPRNTSIDPEKRPFQPPHAARESTHKAITRNFPFKYPTIY